MRRCYTPYPRCDNWDEAENEFPQVGGKKGKSMVTSPLLFLTLVIKALMGTWVSSLFLKISKVKIETVGVLIQVYGVFCYQISNLSNSWYSEMKPVSGKTARCLLDPPHTICIFVDKYWHSVWLAAQHKVQLMSFTQAWDLCVNHRVEGEVKYCL